jgi:hypothetical protein
LPVGWIRGAGIGSRCRSAGRGTGEGEHNNGTAQSLVDASHLPQCSDGRVGALSMR